MCKNHALLSVKTYRQSSFGQPDFRHAIAQGVEFKERAIDVTHNSSRSLCRHDHFLHRSICKSPSSSPASPFCAAPSFANATADLHGAIFCRNRHPVHMKPANVVSNNHQTNLLKLGSGGAIRQCLPASCRTRFLRCIYWCMARGSRLTTASTRPGIASHDKSTL